MKAFNTIPGTHGIQPMETIINYMPTLLFESLACSTEGFIAEQQIMAKVREENYGGIQGLATLLYYTFIFLCDLKIWSTRVCSGVLGPASSPDEPCWRWARRKECLLLVPGPPWHSEPLRGIAIQSPVPSPLLASPHSVSGESPGDGNFH